MKCFRLIVLLTLLSGFTFAQNPAKDNNTEFNNYLEKLFVEGNDCYVSSGNKNNLKRIIGEYQSALDQRRAAGLLTQQSEDSLTMLRLNKLWGDFHYLNSDEDYGSYALAERYFTECLDFTNEPDHRYYHTVNHDRFILYRELGQLFYKQKRYPEAYQMIDAALGEANKYMSPYDDQALDILSQWAICKARTASDKYEMEEAIDAINEVIDCYQDKRSEPYGEALRKKAKILMLQQEKGFGNSIKEASTYYKDYFNRKKREALVHFNVMNSNDREHYWMRIRPFITDCYRLETECPDFLYDVTLFSKSLLLEYTRNQRLNIPSWQQIQACLRTGECAIEFVQYEKNDAKQMGALLLKSQGRPTFIPLGNVDEMMGTPLTNGGTVAQAISVDNPAMKNDLYTDSTLFSMFWPENLLEAIGNGAKKVYFAPDGFFHQLAIEYMLPTESNVNLKSSQFYRLTSTRQLLAASTSSPKQEVLLCGDINFNKANASDMEAATTTVPNDEAAYHFLHAVNAQMADLPGTKAEIETIGQFYNGRHVASLSDTMATEYRSTQMARQFPIVHLATHGYFIGTVSEGTDLKPADYDESMSQNGLFFAGANAAIASENFDPSGYDGILSAREISQMDLSNIDLMVLSACQSGEGYVTEDGIYGLQRGLKNAGVKAMIVSLWSVDDDATSQLMRSFYANLKNNDIHSAFNKAREELIETERTTTRKFNARKLRTEDETSAAFDRPQYYNAFILIDVK